MSEPFDLDKTPRRLACRRCHRQKLQCRWEEEEDTACIRCRRAKVTCASSSPRRLGRPAQSRRTEKEVSNRTSQPQQRRQDPAEIGAAMITQQQYHQDGTGSGGNMAGTQTCTTSPNGRPILPTWPATAAMTITLPEPMLGMSAISENEIWPFSLSTPSLSSPGPNTPLRTPLPTASYEVDRMEPSCPVHEQTGSLEQHVWVENQDQTLPDLQQDCMQKLWSLQLILYAQLKQMRAIVDSESAAHSVAGGPGPRAVEASFPLDSILGSCKSFIDILKSFNIQLADVEGPPPSSAFQAGSPSTGLDTSTVYIAVSCHARLIEIYDKLFRYLGSLLQSSPWEHSHMRFESSLPQLQLGEFQLDNCGNLQVDICARVSLHALRCVERTMGILEEHSATRDCNGKYRGRDSDHTVGGVFGQFGRHKMLNAILASEAECLAGNMSSIESLRYSVNNVTELLGNAM